MKMKIVKQKLNWKQQAKAMTAIRNNKKVDDIDFRIIDSLVRGNENKYFPSWKTLQSQFNVSKSTIARSQKRLKKLGYIKIIRIGENNNNNCELHIIPKP